MSQLRIEYSTLVEQQGTDGAWLWIGSVSSYRPDGTLASTVSRWGESGLTEAAARAAADEWRRDYRVPGTHAVPGLDDFR